MKAKPKNKVSELVDDLNYQVRWGSTSWTKADTLMLSASKMIKKLQKENKKLKHFGVTE
jgi:hypothetical protein